MKQTTLQVDTKIHTVKKKTRNNKHTQKTTIYKSHNLTTILVRSMSEDVPSERQRGRWIKGTFIGVTTPTNDGHVGCSVETKTKNKK